MSRLVLDASVALCWFFEDQSTAYTDTVLDRITMGDEAFTCAIVPFEIAKSLTAAERRRLASTAQIAQFVDELRGLRLNVDLQGTERALGQALQFARSHRLSAYDAGYLDLAIREGLPLATVDRALLNAARSAGVALV